MLASQRVSDALLPRPDPPWTLPICRETQEERFSMTRLFEEHRGELCSYLKRIFGAGPPDPEDVVQQAFVNVASLERPEDIRNPRAYLYRTAYHIAVDERRLIAGRRVAVEPRAAFDRRDDRTPERILIARQRTHVLAEALRAVPERRRRSFLRYRLDGLSCAEIAGRTGSSASAVKKHVSLTRKDLEVALAEAEAVRVPGRGGEVIRRRPRVFP